MAASAVPKNEWKAFFIHLVLYVVVNLALVQINLMSDPQKIWYIWPLIGWGIGLAAHGLALYLHAKSDGRGLFSQPEARGFITHLFVYVAVNLLLAFINLTQTPTELWFQWPLLGWGLALFAHGLVLRRDAPAETKPTQAASSKPRRAKTSARTGRRAAKSA